MKKIITSALFMLAVLAAGAQTKTLKTSVTGKWMIATVEVPGQASYNVDKDVFMLSDAVKANIEAGMVEQRTAELKHQFQFFKKVSFLFQADGKTEMVDPNGVVEKGTYKVDEQNATITTNTVNKENTNISGVLSKIKLLSPNSLEFYTSDPKSGGEVHLVLKKVK